MTKFYAPPQDVPLYGRTTGDRYEYEKQFGLWFRARIAYSLEEVYAREPDGLTDIPPVKVGDTINTEEQLNALPDDTVLRALYSGEAWQKVDDLLFYRIGSTKDYNASATSLRGEFTILWLPEGDGEQA